MFDNNQFDKNLVREGGKVKRMLEKLEGGKGKKISGMSKNSKGGEESDLRNGKENSSGIQKGKAQKQIERINTKLPCYIITRNI